MAVRIRKDGRILCAAMHPIQFGDIYIDDALSYHLSVIAKVLVTDKNHLGPQGHGQWWWANNVPDEIQIDEWWKNEN